MKPKIKTKERNDKISKIASDVMNTINMPRNPLELKQLNQTANMVRPSQSKPNTKKIDKNSTIQSVGNAGVTLSQYGSAFASSNSLAEITSKSKSNVKNQL